MKNVITATRIGRTINLFIGGKLRKKVCDSKETANELYRLILNVKKNVTQEGINKIYAYLNEKTRIAMRCGLETDPDSGEVYLAGFNTPVPQKLVEVIEDYHDNNWNMDSVLNFWKLLMLNPDERVRNDLFGFIGTHDFSITDTGYMIVYKAVAYRDSLSENAELAEFLSNQYLHVKKDWGTSPRKYVVYKDEYGALHITKTATADSWDLETKEVEILGNLAEMYDNLEMLTTPDDAPYTDKWSRQMEIKLGVPVLMPRSDCDSDPARGCSNGLHVGATSYVESYASSGDAVLVCFVNPAHVVAVPNHDNSKMRVTEYFPFALATYENRKIDIVEQSYFESDYTHYEQEELEKMADAVRAKQLPIETAKKADEEDRPMAELEKVIESRLVDLQ
jgi:hypothetical protein